MDTSDLTQFSGSDDEEILLIRSLAQYAGVSPSRMMKWMHDTVVSMDPYAAGTRYGMTVVDIHHFMTHPPTRDFILRYLFERVTVLQFIQEHMTKQAIRALMMTLANNFDQMSQVLEGAPANEEQFRGILTQMLEAHDAD